MKTFKKLIGITAIIAVIGSVFLSCDEGDNPVKSSFGETLKLSGQVNIVKEDNSILIEDDMEKYINSFINPKYEIFKGTLNVSDNKSGTQGNIKTGILNFEINAPGEVLLIPIGNLIESFPSQELNNQGFGDLIKEIKADNEDVKCYLISKLQAESNEYESLRRSNQSGKFSISQFVNYTVSINTDSVSYIYVTDKVKITVTGGEEELGDVTIKCKSGSFSLEKGWNSIKISLSGSLSGDITEAMASIVEIMANPENIMKGGFGKGTVTISFSTGDSGTNWVLE